jgi:hypothetical protein
MAKQQRISPVIKPVIESFNRVYWQTTTFANNPGSAMNGLLVLGDAGVGKSHFVKQALRDAGVQKDVEYIKGGTITAASLYVKLYLNRDPHRILVFDDVDVIGHPEKNKIVPLILGAVEEGKDRKVAWSTAKKNALMEEHNVPFDFGFNGNVILITNYTHAIIAERMRQWSQAFKTRFNDVECIFTHEQKYLYTKHLIEQKDMLGANCKVHKYEHKGKKINGYPQCVCDETVDFIDDNYMNFTDITPRVAIKIADTIYYYKGTQKRVMLQGLIK